MKKLIQKAVKVLAFLLVLALCYGLMDQVLKIKTDDMVSMVKLRQLPPDTVDVLLVGSSHIGTNVDNQQIFRNYGNVAHITFILFLFMICIFSNSATKLLKNPAKSALFPHNR